MEFLLEIHSCPSKATCFHTSNYSQLRRVTGTQILTIICQYSDPLFLEEGVEGKWSQTSTCPSQHCQNPKGCPACPPCYTCISQMFLKLNLAQQAAQLCFTSQGELFILNLLSFSAVHVFFCWPLQGCLISETVPGRNELSRQSWGHRAVPKQMAQQTLGQL